VPEPAFPAFAQGQQHTGQAGVAQRLNHRVAPGCRGFTEGAGKVHGQLATQFAVARSEPCHIGLCYLPTLPGLLVDRRVQPSQQYRLLIAIQRRGLRQYLGRLLVQQAVEFMPTQALEQQGPIPHILQRQQVITPQVDMTGAQQLLRFGRLSQFVRQRLVPPLLDQPLAIALGAGQGIAIAQVQPQRHRRIRVERGEFMGQGQGLVRLPPQAIVIGIGQQPVERKHAVVDTPQRQAEILGGVEVALLQQKRLPDSVIGGYVMPFSQRPHKALAQGTGRLLKNGDFTRRTRTDGQRQVALLKGSAHTEGAIIPLPIGLLIAVGKLADGTGRYAAGGLYRRLPAGGHADRKGGRVEFDPPQRVFQNGAGKSHG